MRKFFIFLILSLISISIFGSSKPEVFLFYSSRCSHCIILKENFLKKIQEKYKDKIVYKELDVYNDPQALNKLIFIFSKFQNKEAVVPVVLVGNNILIGNSEIEKNLEKKIEEVLEKEHKIFHFEKIDLLAIFKEASLLTVITSGLFDGINPCAFAVIVFFISFLGVYGYKKREMIYIGLTYSFTVFITYLLIGFGFFNFLYTISTFHKLIKSFYYFVAIFCFLLAVFSLYDYFRYKRTKDSEDLILQLPKFLKKRITLTIGSHLREKKESIFGIVFGVFLVGFLVSLLEAACTGQIYLPTIVYILKNTQLRLKAFIYLLIYNFMFILPLLLVFLISLLGVSSKKFNIFLKKHLGKVKILLFLLFLTLGTLLIWEDLVRFLDSLIMKFYVL
ncbi:MAG: hypothetical protein QXZ20_00825 [Candidatus Aenigmatarchaeota archaeon]